MRLATGAAFGLFLVLSGGCSSSPQGPDFGGEDGRQLAELVERMNDDTTSVAKLKETFVSGTPAAKKDVQTYRRYRYDLKQANVEGDTATATVLVEKHTGGEPVEKNWSFVKEGEKWKIKAAPLP